MSGKSVDWKAIINRYHEKHFVLLKSFLSLLNLVEPQIQGNQILSSAKEISEVFFFAFKDSISYSTTGKQKVFGVNLLNIFVNKYETNKKKS